MRASERVREGLTLSPNEERYVLTEAMASEMYGNPLVIRIGGDLDRDRFERALRATCDRHENRRTGYEPSGDGRFTRYVESHATVAVERRDMPGADDEAVREAIEGWFFHKAGFTPDALHRYLLIRLAPDDHVFAYFLHHATTDATVTRAFMAEVFEHYAGTTVLEPEVPYSEVWDWDWLSSEAYRKAEAFWTAQLDGAQDIAGLPEDRNAAPQATPARPVRLRLGPNVVDAIKRASVEIGVSDFTYVYAACLVLLTRLTGRPKVFSTFQSAGRRSIPKAEAAFGVFSNGLILATPVDEAESVAALARRLRGEIRAALEHELFPYHHAIRRTGVAPHFGINWFPALETFECPGLRITRPDMSYGRYDHDLNLRFIREDDTGEIDLIIFYRAEAFARDRVEAIAVQIEALLTAFATKVDAPIRGVRSADLAPAGLMPDPTAPLAGGGGGLIHAGFLARAKAAPEATAIVSPQGALTYGALEARTLSLALKLRAQGVKPGDRLAILAERGADLVCAMLAAARLGAVFVVLDAEHPPARLAALLRICAPRLLMTAGRADLAEAARALADGVALFDPTGEAAEDERGLDEASPDAPAYLLFTSGSTGEPKCVAASHRPLAHFLAWQAETFGLTAKDRFTQLSGLAHDPLLRDIFAPLSLGATLLIPEAGAVAEPAKLAPWLRESGATVAHLTPAIGQVLVAGASRAGDLPDLRLMFWGGDLLPPARVDAAARLAPGARHINFYGCTETPQAAGWFEWDGDLNRRAAPIGHGAAGFQLLVLGPDRQPVGLGEVGEIAVRSHYLSLGYLRDGKIVPHAEPQADGTAIYLTGDRGLHLPDGAILALGRADDQVKVRGHRVDLSEVSAVLMACPGVQTATVLAIGEGEGVRLAAFAVAPGLGESELRAAIAARLPGPMQPSTLRLLDRLPLTPNGKIDRAALLAPAADTAPGPQAGPKPVGRPNETEQALMDAWTAILGAREIGRDASFSGLGGDSLSYVQAYLATEEVIGEAPVGWHHMSVAELAALKRKRSNVWSVIDTPLLVRALSICIVVSGHFQLTHFAFTPHGGATGSLLIISGFMFGSLTLPQSFKQASAGPILRSIWSLFVPTALFSALIVLVRSLGHHGVEPYVYSFSADFTDFSRMERDGWVGDDYLWYVHCLLHIFLMLAAAVALLGAAKLFGMGRRRFLWGLFAIACALRFVLPVFWDHRFLGGLYDDRSLETVLPTTHLATVVLGALIAASPARTQKLQLVPVVAAYAVATSYFYGVGPALYLLAGGLLVLAAPRLSVPRVLSPAIFALAGASLWIYLSHMMLRDALGKVGLDGSPLANFAVALVVGVGLWSGWSKAIGWLARRRPLILQADAAA